MTKETELKNINTMLDTAEVQADELRDAILDQKEIIKQEQDELVTLELALEETKNRLETEVLAVDEIVQLTEQTSNLEKNISAQKVVLEQVTNQQMKAVVRTHLDRLYNTLGELRRLYNSLNITMLRGVSINSLKADRESLEAVTRRLNSLESTAGHHAHNYGVASQGHYGNYKTAEGKTFSTNSHNLSNLDSFKALMLSNYSHSANIRADEV